MKIALTGATGFVGSTLLDLALSDGHEVNALTRREQPPRAGTSWIRGDLSDQAALEALCEGVDAVIHVAGVVNAPDKAGFVAGNVDGTRAMLAAARKAAARRFIHVSSLSAREPHLSDYGQSKRDAELAVEESDRTWTIVRPPAIYGPRDTEMFELFRSARWGLVPLPPPGAVSIIHVADLVRLLLSLLPEVPGLLRKTFEPDDGKPGGWSHKELAAAIGYAVGRRVWAPHIPAPTLRLAARVDRLLRGPGAKLTHDRVGYMVHPDWVATSELMLPAEIWQPRIDTREGLKETARWYREQGWL